MEETHLRLGRQTIKLGLQKVIHDLFPEEKLWTVYSILDGVYCRLENSALSIREVKQIETKVNEWLDSHPEITLLDRTGGYYHYQVDNLIIRTIYRANTNISKAEKFRLIPFNEGFISDHSVETKGYSHDLVLPQLLAKTYDISHRWRRQLHIDMVADLNEYIKQGREQELQNISEALQEKQISDIADDILRNKRSLRAILISGPSSSGKTSFAQRLSTQLRVNGLKPIPLSLDNYFVNRENNPKDSEGNYDFETIDALDLPYLQQQVLKLINGEKVDTPLFDFVSGQRQSQTLPLQLASAEILLIEGIHALNPQLLPNIGKSNVYKIYVSALFGMNVDHFNRTPTTEVRLLRRLIRDGRDRGVSPESTLERWASVRKGEIKYVFNHQEDADVMFNSSLLYELNAIRPFAEKQLSQIETHSPYFEIKERLINLLSFFKPIDASHIPFNSIIREFIGGSIYFHEK